MKKILLIALLLFPSLTFAQAAKEVETAIQSLKAAMLSEDEAALKQLTSANLTYGHSSGLIENQEQFLEVFASKKTDYQNWDISNQTISFEGKNLALVRHHVAALISTNGTENKLNIGLLMVWVKEKGDWKLLARQAFRLPQP